MPRPIRATISNAALRHNLAAARRLAGAAKLWAVIKANAYGHGLERAAGALGEADGFAVLDFQEAVRLRAAGVTKPILMLEGFFKPADLALLHQYALTPVIHNPEQVEWLDQAQLRGPLDAYIKVNSGMNRLGFSVDTLRNAWNKLSDSGKVRTLTAMTHFAEADGPGGVKAQLQWFEELVKPFRPSQRSLANSAALIAFPETRLDWARPGIMLYGCSPFAHRSAESLGLRPVMTLSSELIGTQQLQPGERIGYGFSYEAVGEMRIGIIACGYADGYPRHAPSGTPVLVNGQRTRTVGRVSMDMICVDISDIAQAGIGSPVTLWGEGLSADEVAASAGTLSYELLCALAARVPVSEVA